MYFYLLKENEVLEWSINSSIDIMVSITWLAIIFSFWYTISFCKLKQQKRLIPMFERTCGIIPFNELERNGFRLLDVDKQIALLFNSQIRILVSAINVFYSWSFIRGKYWFNFRSIGSNISFYKSARIILRSMFGNLWGKSELWSYCELKELLLKFVLNEFPNKEKSRQPMESEYCSLNPNYNN